MNQPQSPPSLQQAGKFAAEDAWQVLLGTNLPGEFDYVAELEGRLPAGLAGTLYRNGPGMFERDGFRKQHLLDGDGVIQAFDIADSRLRYRSRFVPTPKFQREQAARRFVMPTWTTLAPRWLDNLPGYPRQSQAGVTVYLHQGELLALDEVGPAFALDADTLASRGPRDLVPSAPPRTYKAHAKRDGRTGDWTFLGWNGYRNIDLEVIVRADDGTLKLRRQVRAPRNNYLHDFFATDRHVIVNFHPLVLSPLPMLLGWRSFTDSLSWRPELGNVVVVIPKDESAPVRTFEAPATFMWHAFNAYEDGDGIVADFIGYDAPDHFIGERPLLKTLMRGEAGLAQAPGTVRRYRLPRVGTSLREETLLEVGAEFPSVHPAVSGAVHRYGYGTLAQRDSFTQDGIAVFDLQRPMVEQQFRFGAGFYAGEPIFAPDPQATAGDERGGWLLSLVLDGKAGKSFLAIFDARRVADGPVAKAHLRHHSPLSFHGCWRRSVGGA
jgi:all-trans-8'-apo-beta-carotenal 15,15'-oxygenase